MNTLKVLLAAVALTMCLPGVSGADAVDVLAKELNAALLDLDKMRCEGEARSLLADAKTLDRCTLDAKKCAGVDRIGDHKRLLLGSFDDSLACFDKARLPEVGTKLSDALARYESAVYRWVAVSSARRGARRALASSK